jgi:hypothetical protein
MLYPRVSKMPRAPTAQDASISQICQVVEIGYVWLRIPNSTNWHIIFAKKNSIWDLVKYPPNIEIQRGESEIL